jgi:galactitol-specific phosphotransferase system IIB component
MTEKFNPKEERAFNREKLETVIPNRLATLLEEIAQRRDYQSADWYAVLVAEQTEGLPAVAWNARNLLELWIWIKYCEASRENARRFHEDALRDALGLTVSLSKMFDMRGLVNDFEDQAREALKAVALKDQGVDSVDTNYERVAEAARKIGEYDWYTACNALLSKFAHPTAVLVVGIMHQDETVDHLQITFATQGVYFAGLCVMGLEQLVATIT